MLSKIESVWGEQFGGAFEAERLSGSGVQIPGDMVEFAREKSG